MDRVLEVSRDDQFAVVQPGVLNADLNRPARPARPCGRADPR